MKTKRHWEECKSLPSYYAAQRVALQLKEFARINGYDPRGIRVLSKEDSYKSGRISDSEVVWNDGPDNWPKDFELVEFHGVWYESHDAISVSFYDIIQAGLKGPEHENNKY